MLARTKRLLVFCFSACLLAAGLTSLQARPLAADQNDQRLDALFEELRTSGTFEEAHPVEGRIWGIWLEIDDHAVQTLMQVGVEAMGRRNLRAALRAFDQAVVLAPDYAEGWNKRATVHYFLGNYEDSLADIDKTLALEPRHFGALAGRGLVYGALRDLPKALRSFEAALAVHPNLRGAQANAEILRRELGDRDI
jgi:tetratricopeptide (TPR) repeat protein